MLRSKQIKFMMLVITLSLLVTCGLAANKRIMINDEEVQFNTQVGYPFIDGAERTQVPFRATLEKFGATVSFDSTTRTAIAEKNGIKVEVPIGVKQILRNGVVIPVDTAGLIKDNRTYLPIRAVMEAFGCEVGWDSSQGAVSITFDKEQVVEEVMKDETFFDYYILFKLNEVVYKNYYEGGFAIVNNSYYTSTHVIPTLFGIFEDSYKIVDTGNPFLESIKVGKLYDLSIDSKKVYINEFEYYFEMYYYNNKNNRTYTVSNRDGDEYLFYVLGSYSCINIDEMLEVLEIDLDYEVEIDREAKTVTFIINE